MCRRERSIAEAARETGMAVARQVTEAAANDGDGRAAVQWSARRVRCGDAQCAGLVVHKERCGRRGAGRARMAIDADLDGARRVRAAQLPEVVAVVVPSREAPRVRARRLVSLHRRRRRRADNLGLIVPRGGHCRCDALEGARDASRCAAIDEAGATHGHTRAARRRATTRLERRHRQALGRVDGIELKLWRRKPRREPVLSVEGELECHRCPGLLVAAPVGRRDARHESVRGRSARRCIGCDGGLHQRVEHAKAAAHLAEPHRLRRRHGDLHERAAAQRSAERCGGEHPPARRLIVQVGWAVWGVVLAVEGDIDAHLHPLVAWRRIDGAAEHLGERRGEAAQHGGGGIDRGGGGGDGGVIAVDSRRREATEAAKEALFLAAKIDQEIVVRELDRQLGPAVRRPAQGVQRCDGELRCVVGEPLDARRGEVAVGRVAGEGELKGGRAPQQRRRGGVAGCARHEWWSAALGAEAIGGEACVAHRAVVVAAVAQVAQVELGEASVEPLGGDDGGGRGAEGAAQAMPLGTEEACREVTEAGARGEHARAARARPSSRREAAHRHACGVW